MTEKQEPTTTEENPLLALPSKEKESDLKNYLIDFTGTFLEEEDVTVNMIAEVLAAEFPEFVFAFAEENFIRGYDQALQDTIEGFKLSEEAAQADAEE